ncbi:hypothetical protein [Kitasatospora sp. NPDC094011]|uniref:hypothetical protein n=1 Tax=Kitasatospora sp. NPDC094011 TaxID=3364090 RepID=UPI003810D348
MLSVLSVQSVQRLPVVAGPPPQLPTAPTPVVPSGSSGLSGLSTPSVRPASSAPGTARLLQRVAEQTGLVGVPLTAVPARTPTTVQAAPPKSPPSTPTSTSTSAAKATDTAETPDRAAPADLDELARRLVEPVGRLLRTELRRGRERAGKPYDLRR